MEMVFRSVDRGAILPRFAGLGKVSVHHLRIGIGLNQSCNIFICSAAHAARLILPIFSSESHLPAQG